MRDKNTSNLFYIKNNYFKLEHQRGFGFITLENENNIEELLKSQPHIIKGKKLDCKLAIPKEKIENILSQNKNKKPKRNNSLSIEKSNITIMTKNNKNINKKNQIPLYQRKMFVGGLHSSLTTESLRNYFSQFGKIDKIIINER